MIGARLEVHPDDARPLACLSGEVDLSNVEQLAEVLEQAVPNTARGLVLDLAGVTYLDSTGLRMLFRLARGLAARQQDIRLLVPHRSPLRGVLSLGGVAEVVPVACPCAAEHTTEGVPDV